MRTCLNTATTRGRPLEDDIRLCGEVGFEGIEIDTGKLDEFLEDGSIPDLRALLDESGVDCAGLMAFAFQPFSDAAGKQIERICTYGPICRELGGEVLLSFIAEQPPEEVSRDGAILRAAEVAHHYAVAAADSGLTLALEPIGGQQFMGGPEDALEVVEAADHPGLGIMVDTFHYYKSGVAAEQIAAIPRDRLLIVHINDAEDLPREQLTDANRLYPGLGAIPLDEYLEALRAVGYDGFVSVELFREEYWRQDHALVVRSCMRHLQEVLGS
ncbi:MAG: sugar phosphate isomerase/epimerase [Armatimonadota bacterium]|nr:sugar phosphate isomerase/epimerase [Armatimonadota bacterium]